MSNDQNDINKLQDRIIELEEKIITLEILFNFILNLRPKRSKAVIASLECQLDILLNSLDLPSGRFDRISNYLSKIKERISH